MHAGPQHMAAVLLMAAYISHLPMIPVLASACVLGSMMVLRCASSVLTPLVMALQLRGVGVCSGDPSDSASRPSQVAVSCTVAA